MTGARRITGRTVLVGMLTFFGVIFAVNGAFVYFALDSWPGLDVDNAYRRGLEYNKVLDAADNQAKRGWRSNVALTPRQAGTGRIAVTMADDAGGALAGLRVTLALRRPTHEGYDQMLDLRPGAGGVYSADITIPMAGLWRAVVTARGSGGAIYVMAHDLVVKE